MKYVCDDCDKILTEKETYMKSEWFFGLLFFMPLPLLPLIFVGGIFGAQLSVAIICIIMIVCAMLISKMNRTEMRE